jgi:hypothetical protein
VKLYRVVIDNDQTVDVIADSFMIVNNELHFYVGSHPVADAVFQRERVKNIELVSGDCEADFRWRGAADTNNMSD